MELETRKFFLQFHVQRFLGEENYEKEMLEKVASTKQTKTAKMNSVLKLCIVKEEFSEKLAKRSKSLSNQCLCTVQLPSVAQGDFQLLSF